MDKNSKYIQDMKKILNFDNMDTSDSNFILLSTVKECIEVGQNSAELGKFSEQYIPEKNSDRRLVLIPNHFNQTISVFLSEENVYIKLDIWSYMTIYNIVDHVMRSTKKPMKRNNRSLIYVINDGMYTWNFNNIDHSLVSIETDEYTTKLALLRLLEGIVRAHMHDIKYMDIVNLEDIKNWKMPTYWENHRVSTLLFNVGRSMAQYIEKRRDDGTLYTRIKFYNFKFGLSEYFVKALALGMCQETSTSFVIEYISDDGHIMYPFMQSFLSNFHSKPVFWYEIKVTENGENGENGESLIVDNKVY